MRTVKYELCYNGITLKETTNYEEALEWKGQDSKNSYKTKLEENVSEVSEKEKNWRKYFIAKKNAYREARRKKMLKT